MRLIVKGSYYEATAEATRRGFHVRLAWCETPTSTTMDVDGSEVDAERWRAEPPREPPYPVGTLIGWYHGK